MKLKHIVLGLFITVSVNIVAQQRVQNTEPSYKSWTIEQCQSHIKALETKENYIKSNPEEMKIAEEQGWFTKAEKTRSELKARIEELEK